MQADCDHPDCKGRASSRVTIEYWRRLDVQESLVRELCTRHALEAFRDAGRGPGAMWMGTDVKCVELEGPAVGLLPSPYHRTVRGLTRCLATTTSGRLCVRPWEHSGAHVGRRARLVGERAYSAYGPQNVPIDVAS